jgi:transcriptional regulator with XRE-family HTH domain
MAISERVEASLEDIFEGDAELESDLEAIREAPREAAAFIKKLRSSARLTQGELATKLGITQPRVSAMERGLGPEGPTYLMLKRVAEACGAAWSLEPGVRAADQIVIAPRAGRQAPPGAPSRVVEVLRSLAPPEMRRTEILAALEQDRQVANAVTLLEHALQARFKGISGQKRGSKASTERGSSGGRRAELLKIISEGHGLTRGEILERMGLKGNKIGAMSVSNALTTLTKNQQVRRAGRKYLVS